MPTRAEPPVRKDSDRLNDITNRTRDLKSRYARQLAAVQKNLKEEDRRISGLAATVIREGQWLSLKVEKRITTLDEKEKEKFSRAKKFFDGIAADELEYAGDTGFLRSADASVISHLENLILILRKSEIAETNKAE